MIKAVAFNACCCYCTDWVGNVTDADISVHSGHVFLVPSSKLQHIQIVGVGITLATIM